MPIVVEHYQNRPGYIPGTYLNMPEYAKICMNVPKSAWMAFVLFLYCNPLSTWMCGYLFQCLYKPRSYSLIVWSVFCFRLYIFTRFRITLFNYLCTKLISKTIIVPPWKALWTNLKLSWKVENFNANMKNLYLWHAF